MPTGTAGGTLPAAVAHGQVLSPTEWADALATVTAVWATLTGGATAKTFKGLAIDGSGGAAATPVAREITVTGGGLTINVSASGLTLSGAYGALISQGTGQSSFAGYLDCNGGVGIGGRWTGKRTTVADAGHTVGANDQVIAYTSITASRTITAAPAGSTTSPRYIVVKDESGNASVGNTIVWAPTSGTVDGAGSKTIINAAYGSAWLYSDGTNWFTL